MEFCNGCWLEGGDRFGNILDAHREYVERGKILISHLRNVDQPLPEFTETYIDEGYGNIFEIVHSLTSANYKGTIILDHSPSFVEEAGDGADTAFAVGYIKACINASQQLKKRYEIKKLY